MIHIKFFNMRTTLTRENAQNDMNEIQTSDVKNTLN